MQDGTVLVVDDDLEVRRLVETLVERIGLSVRSGESASIALARLGDERPVLAVLEVESAAQNGLELLRELHDAYGEGLPVILVSGARTSPLDRVAGLLVGADDYIAKPFDPDELVARIRRSLRRANGPGTIAQKHSDDPVLTPREHEVLALLADGQTQREIASALVISPKTVSTHIQHLLAKLGVHSRAQAVAEAYRRGVVQMRTDRGGTEQLPDPSTAVNA